ncbi:MAG: hypothetical protein ACFFEK_03585 [Candidatus Thorarchaeota archaeon]
MLWRQVGVRKSLVITMIVLCLAFSTPLISSGSASISTGKTAYFEYYFCQTGGWHTYLEFTVEEWDQATNIALIRVTNESATQDYRVKIPEWEIVDSAGSIIHGWPYSPIWFDMSSYVNEQVINDTDSWLFNFTVEGSREFHRRTQKVGYQILEDLYYDTEANRIEQYDYSIKNPDNTVHTIRLKYYPGVWNFDSSTTTANGQSATLLTPFLLAGVAAEIIVIIYLITRRLR